MVIWWTQEAEKRYRAYGDDPEVIDAFKALVMEIFENPEAGTDLGRVELAQVPWEKRAADALTSLDLRQSARVLMREIERPTRAVGPPLIAIAVHVSDAPEGVAADHSLLLLGVLYRQYRNTDHPPG